jgi:WD40 repeat protein
MAQTWYLLRDGKVSGPYKMAELQRLAAAGEMAPTDRVRASGWDLWKPVAEVDGLMPNTGAMSTAPEGLTGEPKEVSLDGPVERIEEALKEAQAAAESEGGPWAAICRNPSVAPGRQPGDTVKRKSSHKDQDGSIPWPLALVFAGLGVFIALVIYISSAGKRGYESTASPGEKLRKAQDELEEQIAELNRRTREKGNRPAGVPSEIPPGEVPPGEVQMGYVYTVAYTRDGKRIVCTGADGVMVWWDAMTGKEMVQIGSYSPVVSAVYSPDGASLAWVNYHRWRPSPILEMVSTWHEQGGYRLLGQLGSPVTALAYSPDGKWIASGSEGGEIRAWDASTGEKVVGLHGHQSRVASVTCSHDAKRIASCSDETVRVWDAHTGEEVLTLKGHKHPVLRVAYSPDGKRLASCCPETVRLWDVQTGKEIHTLKARGALSSSSLAFSPDGKRLAWTGGTHWPQKVKVWDAMTGQETVTILASALSVAFSPDGKRIATGGLHRTVQVWDAVTGMEIFTLKPSSRDARR